MLEADRARTGRRDAWLFFAVALLVYALSSPGPTGYDQYARFAQAMVHGSLSLPQRPPHLEMAEYQGRAYFTNPPTPALFLLPFVAIASIEPIRSWLVHWNGGYDLPLGLMQTMLSVAMGALSVALCRVALGRAKLSRQAANWGTVLFGFGSIYWYHSTIGSVWYLAQTIHGTLMWACVAEWLGKQRPFWMGLALAGAFWCRMETMLAAPFLLVATSDRWFDRYWPGLLGKFRWDWLLPLAAPLVGVILLEWGYNLVRYGTIENYGYRMLIEKPEVAPMFPHGLFNIRYWRGHIHVLFEQKPIFMNQYPWVAPAVSGLAIQYTTPAFLYALRAPWDRLTAACWVGIALFMTLLLHHSGTGMTQFGYRFAMDFYPLLTLLTIRGMERSPRQQMRIWHQAFIALCVLFNFWGVWVLNFLRIERLF